jgi:glycosyltransferase involved in cell wall biosynthesis
MTPAGSPLAHAAAAEGLSVREANLHRFLAWREPVDIVHAHDAKSHTWAVIVKRWPVVVSRRVAFAVKRSPVSWWKYRRAQRYLAVSNFVRQRLLDAGIDESKIRVVPDGAPMLDPEPPQHTILAPASSDPAKGGDLIRRLGVNVVLSRDLQRDLPGSKMFLYLTREEGLGSAVLLAMSAGVPVIASNVGGLPEIVVHGVTGLLTANELPAIRDKIAVLDRDPELAARLAQTARRRFLREFTLDHLADRTTAAYLECLP